MVSDPVLKCLLGARVVCLPYRKLGVKNIIHCFSIKLFSEFVLLSLPWEKQECPGSQAGAGGAPGVECGVWGSLYLGALGLGTRRSHAMGPSPQKIMCGRELMHEA